MSVAIPTFQGVDRRALRTGLMGGFLLALAYSLIIGLSSRSWDHLFSQWRADAGYIMLVVIGFGTQVGLFTHLRRVLRGDGTAAMITAGSTATSTTAMVACCLHHLNDVVPLLGLAGAATFLVNYRLPVVLLSVAANGVGIMLMLRALRHAKRIAGTPSPTAGACH
ncbi:MAG TPA: hypothetical protein VI007_00905 [bacterium]